MRKKIMIPLDASIHARHAVQYAIEVAGKIPDMEFTLCHIQPMISLYLIDEARHRPKAQAELQKVYKRNRSAAMELLEETRARMLKSGIDAARIETNTAPRQSSIAGDILKFAEAGSYDAILLGRRGLSSLQEIFVGSVTSNLLANSRVIPIWVVDGKVTSEKILVAVDGSPASLRMVDHVAFMCRDHPALQLDFFHVKPTLSDFCEVDFERMDSALEEAMEAGDEKCIADFSSKALAILEKAGIGRDRMKFRSVTVRLFTGRAIIDEMKKADYGTVVIGKMGAGASSHLGRVTSYVVQKISDAAVWVVP